MAKICSATAVPVVDMSFIQKLTAAGLSYKIVYPIKDNGNGRAYIVWNSNLEWSGNFAIMVSTAGFARIEGAGWQNQFGQPRMTFKTGDQAGDFIDSLPSPRRETTLRLAVPMASSTIGTIVPGFIATMVSDDWLGVRRRRRPRRCSCHRSRPMCRPEIRPRSTSAARARAAPLETRAPTLSTAATRSNSTTPRSA